SKGLKNSRVLAKWATKIGLDTNSKSYQDLVNYWAEQFITKEFCYEIRWDYEAFNLLGDIEGVDYKESCYGTANGDNGRFGEWNDAPVTMFIGMTKPKVPTFVILIFSTKNI